MDSPSQTGFRISYFDSEEGQVVGPPDHLICDETFDESFEKLKGFIRAWMEKNRSADEVGSLSLNLFGPFPVDQCTVDRRTPEQRLEEAESEKERFRSLGRAALSRFEAGDFAAAEQYTAELQEMLPAWGDLADSSDAIHHLHILRGRLALTHGDREEAKRHLLESASTEGSPVMCTFGPNMSLARDLLLAGEREVVLEYFHACRKFWEMGGESLDVWEMYVKAGRLPDFDGNLVY